MFSIFKSEHFLRVYIIVIRWLSCYIFTQKIIWKKVQAENMLRSTLFSCMIIKNSFKIDFLMFELISIFKYKMSIRVSSRYHSTYGSHVPHLYDNCKSLVLHNYYMRILIHQLLPMQTQMHSCETFYVIIKLKHSSK